VKRASGRVALKWNAPLLRTTIKSPDVGPSLALLLPEVMAYINRAGVSSAKPPFSRDHSIDGDTIDLEAGMPVTRPVERGHGLLEVRDRSVEQDERARGSEAQTLRLTRQALDMDHRGLDTGPQLRDGYGDFQRA
jgi:hypothetical protein